MQSISHRDIRSKRIEAISSNRIFMCEGSDCLSIDLVSDRVGFELCSDALRPIKLDALLWNPAADHC